MMKKTMLDRTDTWIGTPLDRLVGLDEAVLMSVVKKLFFVVDDNFAK